MLEQRIGTSTRGREAGDVGGGGGGGGGRRRKRRKEEQEEKEQDAKENRPTKEAQNTATLHLRSKSSLQNAPGEPQKAPWNIRSRPGTDPGMPQAARAWLQNIEKNQSKSVIGETCKSRKTAKCGSLISLWFLIQSSLPGPRSHVIRMVLLLPRLWQAPQGGPEHCTCAANPASQGRGLGKAGQ